MGKNAAWKYYRRLSYNEIVFIPCSECGRIDTGIRFFNRIVVSDEPWQCERCYMSSLINKALSTMESS